MADPEDGLMGADITAEHMLSPDEEDSEVLKFYEGTHIFITGGTGFLGNLLIQKLIRDCQDLIKIYILMRPKNDLSPDDRLDDMFKDPVFERMILENEDFYDKIHLINGNLERNGLGLNEEDRKLLCDKINVVFHLAGTRFEEKLKKAANINVKATKDVIDLAKQMQNLKAFVYVSTVYSHCPQKEVRELFYNIPITHEKLLSITDNLSDDELKKLSPSLLGKWPNNYTFTKAIAENMIKEYGQILPMAIVRPSMVVSTYKDPLSGWANNYYGPVGMVMAATLGLMRSYQAKPDYKIDMVPADFVVNCLLVAGWQIGKEFHNDTNTQIISKDNFNDLEVENNVPIFNLVSAENPLTWRDFMSLIEVNSDKFPALLVVWYYFFTLNPNYYVHKLYTIILHYFPAYIIDTILYVLGKKPMMIKAYKKLHYFQNYFTYFSMQQWIFKNWNTQALWKKLNRTDKRIFNFNMKDIFWYEYCFTFVRGARVYLLKESMDNLPIARKRYSNIKLAHYTLVSLFWLLISGFIKFYLF